MSSSYTISSIQTLFNLVNAIEGNPITGIQVTGSNTITGLISIVGIYGTNVLLSGDNTIGISGGGSSSSFTVPTWSNLTWGTTTTWAATPNVYEDRKILVMTGNTTLSITSLYNGWAGAIKTIQSGNAVSGYSLSLPAGTKVMNAGSGIINLTSGSGAIDVLSFMYDGSTLLANIGNQFT